MQKNNSTVKKQTKNVSRNALQVIIQNLLISDADKFKLLEDLRNMGITDDNDPIVKITMVEGLLAKYNGETAEKIVRERENIQETVEEIVKAGEFFENIMLANEEIVNKFSRELKELRNKDFVELKTNIRIWKHESIIEKEKVIAQFKNDEKEWRNKTEETKKKFKKAEDKYFNFQVTSVIACAIIFFVFLAISKFLIYDDLTTGLNERKVIFEVYRAGSKIKKTDSKAEKIRKLKKTRNAIYDYILELEKSQKEDKNK